LVLKGNHAIRYLSCLGLIVAISAPLTALAESSTAELPQPGGLTTSNEALEEVVSPPNAARVTFRNGGLDHSPQWCHSRERGKFSLSQIIEDVPGVGGGAAENSGAGWERAPTRRPQG